MAYPPEMQASLRRVAATRQRRLAQTPSRLTPQDKSDLLRQYHPDYRPGVMEEIRAGVNRGERAPGELTRLLGGRPYVASEQVDLEAVDYDVDVLVVGAGGAGYAAALAAEEQGARTLLATKLRLGDSNTVMATAIAASTGANPEDDPIIHYLDTMGGGGFTNVPELVAAMVLEGPGTIEWLEGLGVLFDRTTAGDFTLTAAGGYSRLRSLGCQDYTGVEIIRVLRDETLCRGIDTLEFCPLVELLLDASGRCTGALLLRLDTGRPVVVRAQAVVLATGGLGRIHVQGFPTSNHYGATADGLVVAYRAGSRLVFMDTVQYHPTGCVWPDQMFGWLITERCRSLGSHLVNVAGERFIFERETRDAYASAIIRECACGRGVTTATGNTGVWLDTPVVEMTGKGLGRTKLSALHARFLRWGIDVWKEPILVYPTQHYQNGGVLTDEWGRSNVPGLYAAGEVAGGVHGRNRLGANSLIDIFVFGRRAGRQAAEYARQVPLGSLSLEHVRAYQLELDRAGGGSATVSPMLLPDYTGHQGGQHVRTT